MRFQQVYHDGALRDVFVECLSPLPHSGSSPSQPSFGTVPIQGWAQEIAQEYDDRKSTTERTLSAPAGLFHCPFHICSSHISSCFTVRFTFLFTTLVATRRCRCLLRSDYGWVVMPIGLRHVILGILTGGIPGFRMVPLLLHSPSGMAWWFFGFFLLFSLPYHVETIQCYHLLHELAHELVPHTLVLRFCFVLVFFVCFVLVGLFLVGGFCLVVTSSRLSGLLQFTFDGLSISGRPYVCAN